LVHKKCAVIVVAPAVLRETVVVASALSATVAPVLDRVHSKNEYPAGEAAAVASIATTSPQVSTTAPLGSTVPPVVVAIVRVQAEANPLAIITGLAWAWSA
jgi:hypothetical protein